MTIDQTPSAIPGGSNRDDAEDRALVLLEQLVAHRRLAVEPGVDTTALKLLAGMGIEAGGNEIRLDDDVELYSAAMLRGGLSAQARTWLRELHTPLLVDSTNSRIMARAAEGSIDGVVWLAEAQSAGRGRRGRQWFGHFGRNIALSIGVRLPLPASEVAGLSLAVGLAAADVLISFGLQEVALKWPNDLLHRGRKLGGILIELARSEAAASEVVIGLGLNMAGARAVEARIDQPVADLGECDLAISRNALAGRLIAAVHAYAVGYAHAGFAPMQEAWQSLNLHQGKPVRVTAGERVLDGIMTGVDERGALLLRTAQGVEAIAGGEVSLRQR